jgi:hypothetical protein
VDQVTLNATSPAANFTSQFDAVNVTPRSQETRSLTIPLAAGTWRLNATFASYNGTDASAQRTLTMHPPHPPAPPPLPAVLVQLAGAYAVEIGAVLVLVLIATAAFFLGRRSRA